MTINMKIMLYCRGASFCTVSQRT